MLTRYEPGFQFSRGRGTPWEIDQEVAAPGFQIEAAFLVRQSPPLLEVIDQNFAWLVVDRQENATRAGTVFILGNGKAALRGFRNGDWVQSSRMSQRKICCPRDSQKTVSHRTHLS